jgi:conjugative transfer signal peptidase TraF
MAGISPGEDGRAVRGGARSVGFAGLRSFCTTLLLTPLLCAALLAGASIHFNSSGSLPRGLYLVEGRRLGAGGGRRVARGELVLVCPPAGAAALAVERGYLRRGGCAGGSGRLGKLVLAVAGDEVEVGEGGLTVDGCAVQRSASSRGDAAGRPLPHVRAGRYRLRGGEVWLFSPHPRSFDSRYFGVVRAERIEGRLHPLWLVPSWSLSSWTSRLRGCGPSD